MQDRSSNSNLFACIPPNLFSVLSSPLKEVYADLLFLIYQQYRRTIYTLPREVIIDLFTGYLEEAGEDAWLLEDEDYPGEQAGNARERSNQLLRRLIEAGWLVQEQDYDYAFRVSIPDYALVILEALDKVRTGYRMEFRGKILSIYSALTGEDGISYIALHQAHESTLELIDGLKRLNHSIKLYTEKLFEAKDIRALLNQIFDEYQAEVLGEQYYRLKTSEHVSKYRTGILRQVKEFRSNRPQILNEARAMVEEKQAEDELSAENKIYEWLEFIESSFENMDELLEEIDRRNAQYARAAAERLKFQLQQGRGVERHLSAVLAYLAEMARRYGERAVSPEEVNRSIALFPQEVVDEHSWKQPPSARRPHRPHPLPAAFVPDEVRVSKLSRFSVRVAEEVTVEQINRYVDKILEKETSCPLEKVPLNTREEWVKFIYLIIYSRSRRAAYRLEGRRGETVPVKRGLVEIPNMVIKRKENIS